jgi:subfamily B ATP-binding cassette protein MsbA
VPLEVVVLFTLRGIGDYVPTTIRAGWAARSSRACGTTCSRTICACPRPISTEQQSGHLLSKLTNNIELVAAAATSAAISLISDSLSIVFLLIMLFYMNWRLATFCIARGARHRLADADRQSQFSPLQRAHPNSMGDITRVAKEAIDAHRLIKIFNAEDHQTDDSSR